MLTISRFLVAAIVAGSLGLAPTAASAVEDTPVVTQPVSPDTPSEPVAPVALPPVYKNAYSPVVYELDVNNKPVPLSFERWSTFYERQIPVPTWTDYVKYPWSTSIYAVTFWPGGEAAWQWDRLTFAQWQTAGAPKARVAGWIKGSTYHQWGSSSELFTKGEDGVVHRLAPDDWKASGYRPFERISNAGFAKLSWSPEIAKMTNLQLGAGSPISYPQWAAEALPTPRASVRIAGDQFYQFSGSATIWYAGPTVNRPVNYKEWQAAGTPQPTVRPSSQMSPAAALIEAAYLEKLRLAAEQERIAAEKAAADAAAKAAADAAAAAAKAAAAAAEAAAKAAALAAAISAGESVAASLTPPIQITPTDPTAPPATEVAAALTWVRPTSGTTSSSYGWRVHPITGVNTFHAGSDFAARCGDPIYAASSGTVTYSGWNGGYGNYLSISHGFDLTTAYAHIADGGLLVSRGQIVTAGQLIARVGTTGLSTGCHLHFEVRHRGAPIDPVSFLTALRAI
ncbi:murein DD-endopeptidase MepM/ murein hydrolase activator NlpD [Marisediminicola sp. UYEF4]|uniref:M23 family metallopeptidase n=1 Tax=Marisediminicola sp. UYEF4 TaxID=1756384 RepID=UPI003394AE5A